jgi:hypothetical protein
MSRIARIAALASAFACIAPTLAAQSVSDKSSIDQPTAKNAFYVELGGNGIFYSVNFDRLLTPRVAARAGLMFMRAEDEVSNSVEVAVAPVVVSYLFGEGSSHFEAGLGVGLATASIDDVDFGGDSDRGVYGTGVLGYRYQPKTGGVVFRAGLTPLFTTNDFTPWIGLSFGYAF